MTFETLHWLKFWKVTLDSIRNSCDVFSLSLGFIFPITLFSDGIISELSSVKSVRVTDEWTMNLLRFSLTQFLKSQNKRLLHPYAFENLFSSFFFSQFHFEEYVLVSKTLTHLWGVCACGGGGTTATTLRPSLHISVDLKGAPEKFWGTYMWTAIKHLNIHHRIKA